MRLQASLILLAGFILSACYTPEAPPTGYPGPSAARGMPEQLAPQAGVPARPGQPRGRPVAILLPLSGPLADRGQMMLKAAQLALDQPEAPPLDVRDSSGMPDGAASAAQQAIAAGDGMIVGPLTAGETAAVVGPARAAGLPVLAFTSDPNQGRPGIWVLGLTPGAQVRRLVASSRAAGAQRFAALLPDNDFGRLMGAALTDAVTTGGGPAPNVRMYSGGMPGLDAAVRDLAGQSPAGPPFDALLLADTGATLNQIGSLLQRYNVSSPPVRIMGPALWAAAPARAGSSGVLNGAYYAAPDPAARNAFETAFTAKYGTPPGPLTDLVYDATSLARVVTEGGGDPFRSLARPEGFAGADGVIVLAPDGQVRRGLAVFQLQHGTATVIDPAPQSLAGPQS